MGLCLAPVRVTGVTRTGDPPPFPARVDLGGIARDARPAFAMGAVSNPILYATPAESGMIDIGVQEVDDPVRVEDATSVQPPALA